MLVCNKGVTQSNEPADSTWRNLSKATNRIGLCVYHVNKPLDTAHEKIARKVKELSNKEGENHYFKLDTSWANSRLRDWAETNNKNPEQYFMIFGIDQRYLSQLFDSTGSSNNYSKFSILDVEGTYSINTRLKPDSSCVFYLKSDKENSILSNRLWREFMSGRPGRLQTEITIEFNGKDVIKDLSVFINSFEMYQKSSEQFSQSEE